MRAAEVMAMAGAGIRVTGTVQGVGFRPFVWHLAHQLRLRGRVRNDSSGVWIEAWGSAVDLREFERRLCTEAPPLARIDAITTAPLTGDAPDDFLIDSSSGGAVATDVSADAATCPECLAEIFDPANRRYRYPFTNCTHCGPRLSIIETIPYDRAHTSMKAFAMCPQCQAEYDDPADRRFHAQPNACPACGPRAWLTDNRGEPLAGKPGVDAIAQAAELLRRGQIVAIKGIGGFHLACDATNNAAVEALRQRKQRYGKPFALMARDLALIERFAAVSSEEAELLRNRAAPIVLLQRVENEELAEGIAPGQNRLGFMLPYTPLHSLLFEAIEVPLVMTSGNRSDEAQCIDNDAAYRQLGEIADAFLLHDRPIVNRLDDSVARVVAGAPQLLRRARGYAPASLPLPDGLRHGPSVLALGAELKNTFCLTENGRAILSQHQGDLEDATVHRDLRHNLDLYRRLYRQKPEVIAVDMHPDYLSTQLGRQLAQEEGIAIEAVQHHHAHIAACMAEHGIPNDGSKVLGVSFDGLGYGSNGTLWGGEWLLADYRDFERLATLEPVAMPGGSRAIVEPWRNAYAHLEQAIGWSEVARRYPQLEFVKAMASRPLEALAAMVARGINSPRASSAGRLFDAVAAVLGICPERVSYEGEAAMQLEALAASCDKSVAPYPFDIKMRDGLRTVSWSRFWPALLDDVTVGKSLPTVAARFHRTLIELVAGVVEDKLNKHAVRAIVLSGGVMQNQLLLEGLLKRLTTCGVPGLFPRDYPANDGGVALGQSVAAIARIKLT